MKKLVSFLVLMAGLAKADPLAFRATIDVTGISETNSTNWIISGSVYDTSSAGFNGTDVRSNQLFYCETVYKDVDQYLISSVVTQSITNVTFICHYIGTNGTPTVLAPVAGQGYLCANEDGENIPLPVIYGSDGISDFLKDGVIALMQRGFIHRIPTNLTGNYVSMDYPVEFVDVHPTATSAVMSVTAYNTTNVAGLLTGPTTNGTTISFGVGTNGTGGTTVFLQASTNIHISTNGNIYAISATTTNGANGTTGANGTNGTLYVSNVTAIAYDQPAVVSNYVDGLTNFISLWLPSGSNGATGAAGTNGVLADAPADTTIYGRQSNDWVAIQGTYEYFLAYPTNGLAHNGGAAFSNYVFHVAQGTMSNSITLGVYTNPYFRPPKTGRYISSCGISFASATANKVYEMDILHYSDDARTNLLQQKYVTYSTGSGVATAPSFDTGIMQFDVSSTNEILYPRFRSNGFTSSNTASRGRAWYIEYKGPL